MPIMTHPAWCDHTRCEYVADAGGTCTVHVAALLLDGRLSVELRHCVIVEPSGDVVDEGPALAVRGADLFGLPPSSAQRVADALQLGVLLAGGVAA